MVDTQSRGLVCSSSDKAFLSYSRGSRHDTHAHKFNFYSIFLIPVQGMKTSDWCVLRRRSPTK